jgi:predicted metal-binding membrane protein
MTTDGIATQDPPTERLYGLLRGRERVLLAIVAVLAILAWLGTLDRMDGMVMSSRFDGGGFAFFVVLWVVMMAAMMFPSVWPAVTIHARVVRWRAERGKAVAGGTGVFLAGYLAAWTLYGLAGYGVFLLAQAGGLDELSDASLNRYVVGPIAIAAALYQAVPFKQTCLKHCRHPLFFFMDNWREGVRGSAWLGLRHGAYCVGCCWALMLVLLGLGFMSVTWMAAGAGAIAVEKLAPVRFARAASALLALGFLALGILAIAAPHVLPGVGGMAPMDATTPMDTMMP